MWGFTYSCPLYREFQPSSGGLAGSTQKSVNLPFRALGHRTRSPNNIQLVKDVAEDESIKIQDDDVVVPVDISNPNPNDIEFDNLYLDMNGIVNVFTAQSPSLLLTAPGPPVYAPRGQASA